MKNKIQPVTKGWTHIGPGGGGGNSMHAVSVKDNNDLFGACDMGGFYHSANGGDMWRMINLHNQSGTTCVTRDYIDPKIVYNGGGSIYRSLDNGLNWERVFPTHPPSLLEDDDEGAAVSQPGGGWPGGYVTTIEADPGICGTVYAGISPFRYRGFGGPEEGLHIFKSTDKGKTFYIRINSHFIYCVCPCIRNSFVSELPRVSAVKA